MLIVTLLMLLWIAAAAFWLLDTPDPRTNVDLILGTDPLTDDLQVA